MPQASSPPPTSAALAVLSATATGNRTVAVDVVTKREPIAGSRFWLVLEVHGVGGTHSEFYPRKRLETGAQKSEFKLQIPSDADISRSRTGRIVEVSAEVDKLYESESPDPTAPDNDFLLSAPCCAVSDEVELDFRD